MRFQIAIAIPILLAVPSGAAFAQNACDEASARHDWELAIDFCDPEILPDGAPTDDKVHLLLRQGRAYQQVEDWERAAANYGRAFELAPLSAELYVARGELHLYRGEYDRALADADEAIRLDPNAAAAFGLRGFARVETDDFNRALDDLNRTIALDPDNAMAYALRGLAQFFSSGDQTRALDDFDEARSRGCTIDFEIPPATDILKKTPPKHPFFVQCPDS